MPILVATDREVVVIDAERSTSVGHRFRRDARRGGLAAVGKSVVVTHIAGCRSRFRLPIDMGEV